MSGKLIKELARLTGEAVGLYRMIGEGDRILVGLSGGKDSYVLLWMLHYLRRRAPISFEVIAATFDPGFPDFGLEVIAGYCREMGWEHHVAALPIGKIIEERNWEGSPCVLCSRLRRGKLYGLARELCCNKLALGQHFDDIAASFWMSLCRGQGLSTMAPNTAPQNEGNLRIIRPLALAPEALIREFSIAMEFPIAGRCRYEETLKEGDRAFFAGLLGELEKRIPDLRSNLRRSLSKIEPEHLMDPRFLRLPGDEEKCR